MPEQSGKNPKNYTIERNESFAFEQKPIEIDMFNDAEEKEINERVEKRKNKQQVVAEKKQRAEVIKKYRKIKGR